MSSIIRVVLTFDRVIGFNGVLDWPEGLSTQLLMVKLTFSELLKKLFAAIGVTEVTVTVPVCTSAF